VKTKLNKKDKILIAIYIIAFFIPFGLLFVVFIYTILFYIFKLPLKRENELLKHFSNYIKNYIKKIIQ
jgi:hypothetical protein|tara:strand:- start:4294 stop:4497 length:204 start_codon:yes stop_codon:yes gene_type:complete